MYVVRSKKRDALPQPRAEIRQFRTLQQCHSAGSLHLSSSEIRRTLEQNLSFKSELLIPKVSTDAIH